MAHPPAIVFMSHQATAPVIAAYRDLRDGIGGERDVFFLYDETTIPRAETELPAGPEIYAVHYDRLDLDTYPNWQVSFRDWTKKSYEKEGIYGGNLHLAVLEFVRRHPDFPAYWFVEYDVRFSGDWRRFFDAMDASDADLLATTVRRYRHDPRWGWWPALLSPSGEVPHAEKIRAYLPIFRLSNRGCTVLDEMLREGWRGHYEVAVPTLLALRNLAVEDIGGAGEFVPDGRQNLYYTNSHTPWLSPGTFRFRPTMSAPGPIANKLWHPVK